MFALNKADLAGIDALESALRGALEHGFLPQCPADLKHGQPYDPNALEPIMRRANTHHSLWDGVPPIVRTVGNEGEGSGELLDNLLAGLKRLSERPDPWRSPIRRRLRAGLEEEFARRMRLMNMDHGRTEQLVEKVRTGELTLEEAIRQSMGLATPKWGRGGLSHEIVWRQYLPLAPGRHRWFLGPLFF